MNKLFLIIFLLGGWPCIWQPQPPSFIKEYKDLYPSNLHVIESIDNGFLINTCGVIYKTNLLGEEEWTYRTQDTAIIALVDLYFSRIFTDSQGIYLFGYMNFGTPYYARLDLQGKLQFDTAFMDWNIEGEKIHNVRSVTFDGDAIVLIGNYFHNLEVVDTSNGNNQWTWDKQCYQFIRFDKMNCKRLSSVYDCFTEDSTLSQYPYGTTIRVNTTDKGLLNVAAFAKIRFNPNPKQSSLFLICTDSSGKVTRYKSLFEHPIFQNFNLDPDYSNLLAGSWAWEKGAESQYPELFRTDKLYDGICIKMDLNDVGTVFPPNRHEYLVYYNTEGDFEKIVRLDTFTESGIVRKHNTWFELRDSNKSFIWNRKIELPGEGTAMMYHTGEYRTIHGGLFFTYHLGGNNPDMLLKYYLYYLNPNGWAVNVPKIEGIEDLTSPWFDAQGALALPESFLDWEWSLMDVTGKQVSHSATLSSGVYIVQLHNPSTGEQRYWKVFKE